MRILFLLSSLVFLLSACAQERSYTVKNLKISPDIRPVQTAIASQNVGLQVTDMRGDARVGMKRFGFEDESPVVVLDTAQPVLAALEDAFSKVGFVGTAFYETSEPSLDVRITGISYNKKARVVSGEEELIVRAEVVARQNGQIVTRHYETVSHDSDLIRPSATYQLKRIDQTISQGLADLIRKIISDRQLIAFLKG